MRLTHWVSVRKPNIHRLPFFSTKRAGKHWQQSEKTRHNEFMRQYEEDRKTALQENITISNPKKAEKYQVSISKQILMRGTGFVGGKGRVCEIYQTEIDAGTRAKRIKAEYGQGGAAGRLTV